MLKIEKTETYGWEAAIRGMRNPMNSWAKSDSEQKYYGGDSYKGVFKYTYFKYATTIWPKDFLELTIEGLNKYRNAYLETKDKKYWWQMIQLLPSSYNQKRTVMLNYEVLANMYKSRKNHKLNEWHTLCDWIKTLPYSELITGEEE